MIFGRLVAAPGFVGSVAEGFEGAVGTARFAGDADLASVMDEFVRELNPVILRNDLHQFLLYFFGIGRCGEAEAVGEAEHVRVNHYALGQAEGYSQHDVGGLARGAGEGEHFGHCFGNFAVEVFDEPFGRAGDGLGLVVIKAR